MTTSGCRDERPGTLRGRGLFNWYRETTGQTRRVFWTCLVAWGLDAADGLTYQYLIPIIVTGLGITLAQAGIVGERQLLHLRTRRLAWRLALRSGGPGAYPSRVTILWFSVFFGAIRLRPFVSPTTHPARTARPGFRRRMGRGCRAVGRTDQASAPWSRPGHRAQCGSHRLPEWRRSWPGPIAAGIGPKLWLARSLLDRGSSPRCSSSLSVAAMMTRSSTRSPGAHRLKGPQLHRHLRPHTDRGDCRGLLCSP